MAPRENESLLYHIRRMEPRDLHTVMTLDRLVFSDPWPESAYTQELYFNPQAHYFILELTRSVPHWRWPWKPRASNLVGFAGIRIEQERGHISTLAIHPDWRGVGFGELLLITVLLQATELEASSATLEVRASNTVAQRLYAKYNFILMGQHTHYYQDGEDALLLEVQPLDTPYRQQLLLRRQQLQTRIHRRLGSGSRAARTAA